ncbi:hypothetical protein LMG3410_01580 [Achromobacter aegrifaciens]|uniref:DUF4760 domain-containing protein n=1 Tax=Achromobacter mucicolens TaxID=1389922 RepID=A0ABM8LKU1_9BURK|nr:hypothetical protein LMG3410_01580 [Achromobacter aegrifaciens]CAB3912863.1 hypothetical protein LMG3415_05068 [Achromobacter mucicolens]
MRTSPGLWSIWAVALGAAVGIPVAMGAMIVLCRKDLIDERYEFRARYSSIAHLVLYAVVLLILILSCILFSRPDPDLLLYLLIAVAFGLAFGFCAGAAAYSHANLRRVVGTFQPTHRGARKITIVVRQEGAHLWSLHIVGDGDLWRGVIYRICAWFRLFGCKGWRELVHSTKELRALRQKLIEIAHGLVVEAERRGERDFSLILASPLLAGPRRQLRKDLREKFSCHPTEEWEFRRVKRTLSRVEVVLGKLGYGWKLRRSRRRILAEGVQFWNRTGPRPGPVSDAYRMVPRGRRVIRS